MERKRKRPNPFPLSPARPCGLPWPAHRARGPPPPLPLWPARPQWPKQSAPPLAGPRRGRASAGRRGPSGAPPSRKPSITPTRAPAPAACAAQQRSPRPAWHFPSRNPLAARAAHLLGPASAPLPRPLGQLGPVTRSRPSPFPARMQPPHASVGVPSRRQEHCSSSPNRAKRFSRPRCRFCAHISRFSLSTSQTQALPPSISPAPVSQPLPARSRRRGTQPARPVACSQHGDRR
jgi:hypothetical protein